MCPWSVRSVVGVRTSASDSTRPSSTSHTGEVVETCQGVTSVGHPRSTYRRLTLTTTSTIGTSGDPEPVFSWTVPTKNGFPDGRRLRSPVPRTTIHVSLYHLWTPSSCTPGPTLRCLSVFLRSRRVPSPVQTSQGILPLSGEWRSTSLPGRRQRCVRSVAEGGT